MIDLQLKQYSQWSKTLIIGDYAYTLRLDYYTDLYYWNGPIRIYNESYDAIDIDEEEYIFIRNNPELFVLLVQHCTQCKVTRTGIELTWEISMQSNYYYCQSNGEVCYYLDQGTINVCDECIIITQEEYEFIQNNKELFTNLLIHNVYNTLRSYYISLVLCTRVFALVTTAIDPRAISIRLMQPTKK